MARKVIEEPFLLLESDLVFDEALLADMLYPDRIAVAKMQPWMNGTSVTVNPSLKVKAFWANSMNSLGGAKYKTVNIYSLSLRSWNKIIKLLDRRIIEGKVNDYYETVFAEMIADGSLDLTVVSFDDKPWYEIDTIDDLAEAEKLFALNSHFPEKKISVLKTNFKIPIIEAMPAPLKEPGVIKVAKTIQDPI